MYITSLIIEASFSSKYACTPLIRLSHVCPFDGCDTIPVGLSTKINLHLHTKYEDSSLPVQFYSAFPANLPTSLLRAVLLFPLLLLSLFPHPAKFPLFMLYRANLFVVSPSTFCIRKRTSFPSSAGPSRYCKKCAILTSRKIYETFLSVLHKLLSL